MMTVKTRSDRQSSAFSIENLTHAAIEPDPEQPRKDFDPVGLSELAYSMASEGLLQPISVRPAEDSADHAPRYIIIAGERRWRAAGQMGWETIEARVLSHLSPQETAKLQLLENIVRRDLNPVEEAKALHRMLHEGYTADELAASLGTTVGRIAYKIKLLDARTDILEMVVAGSIRYNYAHTMARLTDNDQGRVLAALMKRNLSYVEVHNLCNRILDEANQTDLGFNLQPMTQEQTKVVKTFNKTLRSIGKMLDRVNTMETERPGSVAAALGAKSETVEAQIEECTKRLHLLKKALRTTRMIDISEAI